MTDSTIRVLGGGSLALGAISILQASRPSPIDVAELIFGCVAALFGLFCLWWRRPEHGDPQDFRPRYALIYVACLGISIGLIVWGGLNGGVEVVVGTILATPLLTVGLIGMGFLVHVASVKRGPRG